jgi:hypothetical protein
MDHPELRGPVKVLSVGIDPLPALRQGVSGISICVAKLKQPTKDRTHPGAG